MPPISNDGQRIYDMSLIADQHGSSRRTTSGANSTTAPIAPGDCSQVIPEFGRAKDVERIFGIKKGTLYNLLSDGKIKGVLLRVRGEKSGLRLFEMHSIRKLLMEAQFQ